MDQCFFAALELLAHGVQSAAPLSYRSTP